MSRSFTIYWRPDGWKGIGEGNSPSSAYGSGFIGKIDAGDRVYITNVMKGQLRLMSAFTVECVVASSENVYSASEKLIAVDGSAVPVLARVVPIELAERLRFTTGSGIESSVKITDAGTVDGQAMRAVRQLTFESAQILESILQHAPKEGWSEEELFAAVTAYLAMAFRIRSGERVVKKQHYQDLANRFGRTEGAFESWMQNITYVLSQMGREWIEGLPPAKNVDVNIVIRIERIIAEVEGKSILNSASESVKVVQARSKVSVRPNGSKTPKMSTVSISTYSRDETVKAWVLERANGVCEACDKPAPFVDVNEFPFLEVHHVKHLADGGSDTPSNAVAVCPNCHRRLYYARDARSFRESLFSKVVGLSRE